ncbi:uncharacterized protein LOC105848533 [Hydra vulgaris]|uniref:uncharacterized protein LOC105848533 n=1 Tax=Hydra vulgaris TaxID=6087 RepID=UPI001F5F0995|nr:uncharacterized protein LOC105848533 [Hydra vulgaris]
MADIWRIKRINYERKMNEILIFEKMPLIHCAPQFTVPQLPLTWLSEVMVAWYRMLLVKQLLCKEQLFLLRQLQLSLLMKLGSQVKVIGSRQNDGEWVKYRDAVKNLLFNEAVVSKPVSENFTNINVESIIPYQISAKSYIIKFIKLSIIKFYTDQAKAYIKAKKDKVVQSAADREEVEKELDRSSSLRGFFPATTTSKKRLDNLSKKSPPSSQQGDHEKLQVTLDEYVKITKWDSQSSCQLDFDTVLTLACIMSNLPFNIVETLGMKLLLNYLAPKAIIKTPKTLATTKLDMIHCNVEKAITNQLEEEVPECQSVAFTSDGWTAKNGDPFESLTLHYINSDFELKKYSLDCQAHLNRKTGPLLAKGLDTMISKYEVLARPDLKRTCVNDGAVNMKAAVSLATLLDKQLVCVDHMLNNCLKDTLGNGEVKIIVDKCKRLAQRTHQSTKDWYEIKQESESLGCNPIKLIQSVQTRWNSNAMLFKSVLRNEQGLKSVRDNSLNANLTILIPSDEDFQVIAELHPFLAKCQEYSEIWSSDKTPTVHKIQQHLFSLITMCHRTVTQNTSGSRIAKDAMTRFIEYLETRIPDKGTEVNDFNLASVFDPFYRGYSITLIKGNKDHRWNNRPTGR